MKLSVRATNSIGSPSRSMDDLGGSMSKLTLLSNVSGISEVSLTGDCIVLALFGRVRSVGVEGGSRRVKDLDVRRGLGRGDELFLLDDMIIPLVSLFVLVQVRRVSRWEAKLSATGNVMGAGTSQAVL